MMPVLRSLGESKTFEQAFDEGAVAVNLAHLMHADA
jgi:hypothetical protein